jgi:uncharacterized protein YbjT (DUF2867 family)
LNGRIVVTGASGNVGAELVRLLDAAGHEVLCAVPDPIEVHERLGRHVAAVSFAFDRTHTHAEAFAGARALFLMRPPHLGDPRAVAPAIDAATRAGVRHIVFLSLQGVERNPIVPHHRIERLLEASGVPWTFLRPSFFMQNLSTTHRDDLRDRDRIFVPAGRGRTAFIDARDIAAVAMEILTEPGHEHRAYELTGAEALTYDDVAGILTDVLGRDIRYERPSALRFWRELRRHGHPTPYVNVMTALYTVSRFGLAAHLTDTTEALLGRRPIPFRQFAIDHAHLWTRDAAPEARAA